METKIAKEKIKKHLN